MAATGKERAFAGERVSGPRGLLIGNDRSLAERLRRRRWAVVLQAVPDLADLHVVDLGGTARFWERAPVLPREVTVVNLHEAAPLEGATRAVRTVEGDALRADELLAGESFDLAFSNSLIEHLGGHASLVRFAEVVSALAPTYVVQTPYRYFPVEPHWMFPAFQFLPVAARARIAARWPLGHTHGWEPAQATSEVLATELLSAGQMRAYFPDAELHWERVGGLPKSMLAVRRARAA